MWLGLRQVAWILLSLAALPRPMLAQDVRVFAGVVGGVATLSGDPSGVVTADGFAISMYKPENGTAVNAFLGVHLREYVSVQANYIWNQNALLVFTGVGEPGASRFFEQARASTQHAAIGDVLVYFRERASRIRPYLSAGAGVLRLETTGRGSSVDGGLTAPSPNTASTEAVLRVAVGVDVAAGTRLRLRYSFSESVSKNPFSRYLDPAGSRGLMNFQNLIGVVLAL